ncbi:MAG: pyruvate kinase [Planctomycetes bacterium RBG_13_63_9]|nr:MAG: pyruvate kinase [Planctomycetes bacterium RBG_13_63_9]
MSASQPPGRPRSSQTKIVATLGPASSEEGQLADLLSAGVDVFRINTAHGDRSEHQGRLDAVRRVAAEAGRPVAVLVDLAGPKIRLGELPDGQLMCDAGDRLRFVRLPTSRSETKPSERARADGGDEDLRELTTTYEPLVDELAVGDRVMLADGTVSFVVEEVGDGYAECRVVQPGLLRSRQGVNLPGVKLSAAALGPKDRENALWAAEQDIDFVGLSFVRTAEEVRQLKSLLLSHNAQTQVVAKIEKPEALDHLQEIVEAADAVMVARGDLGVEIDIARVAVVQKEIIAACRRWRKPVIIATQMLDSMQHSRLPTRAEVTDVANAILDGADACMLSGETAIGNYPLQAVEMMHRIALATEPLCRSYAPPSSEDPTVENANQITEATVYAAGALAEQLEAAMMVVASASGATALSVAKNRNSVPTVGISDSQSTLRRMCLYWGVHPLAGAPTGDHHALLRYVTEWGRNVGLLDPRDRVVLVAGTGLAVTAHNMIVVHELE